MHNDPVSYLFKFIGEGQCILKGTMIFPEYERYATFKTYICQTFRNGRVHEDFGCYWFPRLHINKILVYIIKLHFLLNLYQTLRNDNLLNPPPPMF